MAGRGSYGVALTATDLATAKIDAVNKRLAAMQAPMQRLQRSLARFGDLTGISRLSRGFDSMARGALNALQAVGRIVEPLGMITGAASIAGLYKMVSAFGQWGTTLQTSSARLGVGAERLNALQGAARLAGDSAEGMTSGLQALNQTLTDTVGGRNADAYQYFQSLGVHFKDDITGQARNAADVLPELIDALNRIQDPTLRARVGTSLLGGAYDQLQRTINGGSRALDANIRAARAYAGLTPAQITAATDLNRAQEELWLSVEGLAHAIAAELSPYISPLLHDMAEWIKLNRGWLAQEIHVRIKQFGDWIKGIDLAKVLDDVKALAERADNVAKALGGWKVVGEAILAYFAVGWVAKILAPFASVLKVLSLIPGSGVTAATLAEAGLAAGAVGATLALSGDAGPNSAPNTTPEQEEANRQAARAAGAITPMEWWRRTMPSWMGGDPAPPPAPPPAPGTANPTTIPQDQSAANLRIARDYFLAKGLPPAQVAGLLGNFVPESGMNPGAFNPAGGGQGAQGIAQWRGARIDEYRRQTGHDPRHGTLQEQLDYVWWELTQGPYRGAFRNLQSAGNDPAQAGYNVQRDYEVGSLDPAELARIAEARGRLARGLLPFVAPPSAAAAPPPAAPPAPPTAAGPSANIGGGAANSNATQSAQTLRGSVDMNLNLRGFPPGTQTSSTVRGDIVSGPPRVMHSLPVTGFAAP